MHAQHAQRERIVFGESAQPVQRHGDRDAGLAGQPGQQISRVGVDCAATHVKQRPPRSRDQLRRFPDAFRIWRPRQPVAPQMDLLRIGKRCLCQQHVFGQVHHHRTRTPRTRNVVGGLDCPGQIAHVAHQEAVLRDRARDPDRVGFLEGVVADQFGGHLTGEDHDGHRVHVGVGDARYRVGGTGPAGDQYRTHTPRGLGIAFGHVRAALLMAYKNVLKARLEAGDFVVDVDDGAAGMPEDDLDALGLQRPYEDFGAGHGFGGCGHRLAFGAQRRTGGSDQRDRVGTHGYLTGLDGENWSGFLVRSVWLPGSIPRPQALLEPPYL